MYLVTELVSGACREARDEMDRPARKEGETPRLQSKDGKGGGESQLAA